MVESQPPPADDAKRPLWKSPFAIAFVVGIVTITLMPLLQRRLLRAPPPLRPLPAWALQSSTGQPLGAAQLLGKVWIASFASEACGQSCLARQKVFGTMLDHTEDLGDKIHLVSFLLPDGAAGADGGRGGALAQLAQVSATGRWHFAQGPAADLEALVYGQFRAAFQAFSPADAGVVPAHFADLPAFALVDQEGALRGFWVDDDPGRGNCINAARLLARLGPRP